MLKNTTLNLSKYLVKRLSIFLLFICATVVTTAQVYNNGNLSTGATSSNGVAAPAGTTWSELQTGNTVIGFNANIAQGISLADDFTVPAGQRWSVSKLTFYGYSTGFAGTTSPFTDVRFRIFNTNPTVGSPAPIFGDLTTNRFAASNSASIYRIVNASPGTTRAIWKVEANANIALDPGTYWIEWQLGSGSLGNFLPPKTVAGTVTQPGNNAFQRIIATNTWAPLNDGANRQDMPFTVNYTTLPCVAPTASVLSQVGYPTTTVSLINETFTTAVPNPAGWSSQNLSSPIGLQPNWFQGNTGVFPGNTPPGYIAANFQLTGGANTLSAWLFTPNINMRNGDSLTFFTRSTDGQFPDRLQVRRSQNGASTNAGTSNTSVGDFTDLLLDINPTYTTTGYPTAWTKFTVVMSGLPAAGVSGRIAFRYFVENGGPAGANSDYIGIDDVVYRTPGPSVPPNTCLGSTANLKVDITGGTAPYKVTINTVPPTTPIVVNNYQSGDNIPVTPTATTQYTLTSVEGCGVGTGNSGTPTVVVSNAPFPTLTVSALPNTPLCLGDPTLLTVGMQGSGLVVPLNLSQSSSNTITTGNSVGCVFSGSHTDNSFWRAYDLSTASISSPNYTINAVQFGIELADASGVGTTQPVTVRLYTSAGAFPNGVRTLVGTQTYDIPDQANSLFVANLTTPVTVASNAILVVEVFTPNGLPAGHRFWIGSNNLPETAPSYLSAASCGLANPTATAAIGFPNMHIVLNLQGSYVTGVLPSGTTYLWTPSTGLSNPTSNPVGASPMTTTTYTVLVTLPGGCQGTATKTVVVNQPPAVTTQPANVVVCANSSATFSVAATGAGPLVYQWQEQVGGVGAWNNLSNGAPYSGVNTSTLIINPATGLLSTNRYRCVVTGICNPNTTSNPATLTVNPLPVIPITPAGPVCGGVQNVFGTKLEVGSAPPPVPGSVIVNSGPITVNIPDNNTAGITTQLAVAGIPANATITGYRVKLNMTHTWNGDMVFALKAPNGSIVNLDYYLSATGGTGVTTGFVNTVINSTTTSAALSSGSNPYTGTFRSDAAAPGATPPSGPTGNIPNVTSAAAFVASLTAANANGNYTLAMYDGGPADLGVLTNWELVIEYTTPGTIPGGTLSYVWTPATGLYTDANASIPYVAGSDRNIVYAAPTALTTYTVTATNGTSGCVNTNSVLVNYTPPAPNVTPNPVSMCLGAPAVMLKSSSSTTTVANFTSGPINVAIPEGNLPTRPATAASSVIAVSGIPANATITGVAAKINATHPYANDIVAVLKAPSGAVINLDAIGGYANNAGANYLDTKFSSAGTTSISTGTAPFTGTWRADLAGVTFTAFGFTLSGGPVGFDPTTTNWATYMGTLAGGAANGNWTLAAYDAGAPDIGNLTKWDLEITYVEGVPSTPAVWSPATGLYSDATAQTAYVAGTAVDSVWVKPSTPVVHNYDVTVQNLPMADPSNPAAIAIPSAGAGNPYPSVISVNNYASTGVGVASVTLNGITHTWGVDIDVLLQSPSGVNVVLMSDIGGGDPVPNATYTFQDGAPALNATAANPSGTYKPTNNGATDNFPSPGPGSVTQASPTLASFGTTANVNGDWKLFVVDDEAGDQGSISGGWSIKFDTRSMACTSPARRVVVTVRDTVKIITNPVSTSACITTGTNTRATFSVTATGDALTYQWQTSTPGGTWSNIVNDANYSGATTSTLTISNPPVSWNGRLYQVIVTGSCGSKTAPSGTVSSVLLTVPSVTLTISGLTKLLPGLTTTLVASANPAPVSYEWYRNGSLVATTPHPTNQLLVGVDGIGDYTVRTITNSCANVSNLVTVSDSASGNVFIYPNPNNGIFQVRYHAAFNSRAPRGLNIYDDKGSRISISQYPNTAPYQRMNVDLRNHGKGIYWVEVVDVNGERLAMGRAVVL